MPMKYRMCPRSTMTARFTLHFILHSLNQTPINYLYRGMNSTIRILKNSGIFTRRISESNLFLNERNRDVIVMFLKLD